ncbi:hypothetical protein VTN77DRAFT_1370 [Rasamsonia byssochlamydoides]|uniref:uncharacterized protein n=1 Tax=Rasamsonia byssochlamydoides TaxID=89139 RepID=UPI0037430DEE
MPPCHLTIETDFSCSKLPGIGLFLSFLLNDLTGNYGCHGVLRTSITLTTVNKGGRLVPLAHDTRGKANDNTEHHARLLSSLYRVRSRHERIGCFFIECHPDGPACNSTKSNR